MRCLSMPGNISQLAVEIEAMEAQMADQNSKNSDRKPKKSMDDQAMDDDGDFFLPFDDIEEATEHHSVDRKGSFLPRFSFDDSVREVVHEILEDSPPSSTDCEKDTEEPPTVPSAEAFIGELVSVLGVVPPNKPVERSPKSVVPDCIRQPPQNGIQAERTSTPQTPYRHLFGRFVTTSDNTSANDDDDDAFTKLSKEERANSMPVHKSSPMMSKKPSLKRVSSFLSNGSRVSSSNSLKRNVSFHKLEVREYNIALSDHPGCSYGPPISLGWDYRDKETIPLDEYEEKRSPRRSVDELVLSYNVRRFLLLKRAGYSKQELQEAMQEVERVKRERLVTDLFLPASKIDEQLEDLFDKVKGVFFPMSL